ncbi:MAG: hypothetical protein ACYDA6_02580 [Solirubrobacteraceae bacterium]
MAIWIFLALIVLVKIPVVALMLWIPYRSDSAMRSTPVPVAETDGPQNDDDGGGGPSGGVRPRAPRPRRGPHADLASPSAPARVRPAGGRFAGRPGRRERVG